MLLVIGRTCSGKSTLTKYLKNFEPVVSYCDREPRGDETPGVEHIFVSKMEFTMLKESREIVAYTEIDGVRYMALKEQCHDNSIYVIDPNGSKQITDDVFRVYVFANEDIRRYRANERGFDRFEKRNKAEDAQFTEYEKSHNWDLWLSSETGSPEELAKQVTDAYNEWLKKR